MNIEKTDIIKKIVWLRLAQILVNERYKNELYQFIWQWGMKVLL